MNEVWKAIQGYEFKYEVSNYGRVRSLDHFVEQTNHGTITRRMYRGKMLTAQKRPNGYCMVHLSNGSKSEWFSVHRLVATAFIPQKDGCNIVNHLDCDPSNNNVSNLEWTTYSGNMRYASSLGHMNGNRENIKKAQEKRKTPVIAKDANGNIYEFDSQIEAGEKLGVCASHIAMACRKEYGYKKLKGYEFFYKNPEGRKINPDKIAMSEEERKNRLRLRMLGNKHSKGRKTTQKMIDAIKSRGNAVLQYTLDGKFVKRYASVNEVRTETGHNVEYALNKQKNHQSVGFIWRYENE